MQHLDMNSGEVKGNNPFQLSRTTVDNSFKKASCDLSRIVGYSANGEVILRGTTHNPFAGQGALPFTELQRPASGSVIAYNDKPSLSSTKRRNKGTAPAIDEIGQLIKTSPVVAPSWSSPFAGGQGPWTDSTTASVSKQTELQKLAAARYAAILDEPQGKWH